MKKLIDVYPYRLKDGTPEFLIFKRSSKKVYANQWRMVGGKVKEEETRWEAALRELSEETGLKPDLFWAIPSVNKFYEAKTDSIHLIPAFAAQISPTEEIELNEEHSEFKWVTVNEANKLIKWPEQQRLINLTHDILTKQFLEILPEWIIETS